MALTAFAAATAFAADGNIAGTVSTSDGKRIAAILLLHDLSTVRVVGSKAFDHEFSSRSDGTFSLTGVPPGKYEICVDAPQEAIVDPCGWGRSDADNTITVRTGAAMNNIRLQVDRGYFYQVRVNDPEHVLPLVGGTAGAALSLHVKTADQKSRNLRLLSSDKNGRTHFLIIPFDQHVTLMAHSETLAVKDDSGTAVAGAVSSVSTAIGAGLNPGPVVVNVGKK